MKITGQNLNNSVGHLDSSKLDKAGQKSGSSPSPASSSNDPTSPAQVNVSERAQAMQKARELAGDQTVDEAKVARLQKLIDEGKYNVDASAVADRLVDEHLLFPE